MKQEVTMYTLICDGCGKNVCEGSNFAAWSDIDGARNEADWKEWIQLNDEDLCPNCWEWNEDETDHIKKNQNK